MSNSCGECTACCTLLPIEWLDKPAGMDCVHCDKGCLIHDTKHAECTDFNCMWLDSGVNNAELRPDRCGVVFEKTDDTNIYGNVAFLGDVARRQMQDFQQQGYTVRLSEQV